MPSKGPVLVLRAACFWLAAHLRTRPRQDQGVKEERRGRKQHKLGGAGGSRTQGPRNAEHVVSTRGSQQRTAAAKAQGEPEAGKRVREHQAKETQETKEGKRRKGEDQRGNSENQGLCNHGNINTTTL